jgi:hypothetical protein
MNIQGPLRKIIADYSDAFDIFGDRVFPVVAPQTSSYPLVVLTVTGNNPAPTKTGTSKVDNVMVEARVYAKEFGECATGDETMRIAIDHFRGDVTFLGQTTAIDSIEYMTTQQGIEPDSMLLVSVSMYKVRIKRDGFTGQTYTNLQYFASDDEAIAAGLQVNDIYRLSTNNFYGMKGGTVVTVVQ